MNSIPFCGVYTALITPMLEGKVCHKDLQDLVSQQVKEGIDGLVAVGTTGESPTLTHEEHLEVIRLTCEAAEGNVPVIAGSGSNCTEEAITLTRNAEKAGANAFLLVAPYYNKPSQEGLFQHFSAIAGVTEKPIILYSIPSRCGIEIGVDTVARLFEKHPQICAIKEAGGSCDRVGDLIENLGDDFVVLSGDDGLTLPFMAMGARGVISVASNLVANDLETMVHETLNKNPDMAAAIHQKFYKLFNHLFLEPNPVPIKYALRRAGKIQSEEVRLPLCSMSEENRAVLDQTLVELGF